MNTRLLALAASAALATGLQFATAAQSAATTQPTPPTPSAPAKAEMKSDAELARELITKASAYLLAQQDSKSGGWSVPPEGVQRPAFPAITALALRGLLEPTAGMETTDPADPAIAKAVAYMLSFQQKDGGIYDRILPSYNTAISLSALALIDDPKAKAAIKPAQDFLKKLQWSETTDPTLGGGEAAQVVDKNHPFYGGIGYGQHGRPDLSNLSFMIEGLHDTGVSGEDAAMRRALVFLSRVQMLDDANDMPYADGSRQGGFIYATGTNKDNQAIGQSQAMAPIEETLDDGTKVSRLRAYGSMTYAGFKSLIYAGLKRNDPRVLAAMEWIGNNYTLEENPGLGTDGMYYYFLMFSRALEASGQEQISVTPRPAANRTILVSPLGLQDRDLLRRLEARAAESDLVRKTMYVRPMDAGGYRGTLLIEPREGADPQAVVKMLSDLISEAPTGVQGARTPQAAVWTGEGTIMGSVRADWRHDLIARLAELQNDDGSFKILDDRWMENDPVLITAYALIALRHAAQRE